MKIKNCLTRYTFVQWRFFFSISLNKYKHYFRILNFKSPLMTVKVDTKERFHVITIQEPVLAANMTEAVSKLLLWHLTLHVKNVVLNLADVREIDPAVAARITEIQQKFYDAHCSLVICGLQSRVERFLDAAELLELMNVVPTESEAGDIIQMEEIERELGQGPDQPAG